MKFRKKLYLMFQIACISSAPIFILFLTWFEMWLYLIKFSIYIAVFSIMNYLEFFEVIKWKWNSEKRKAMGNNECDL